MVVSSCPSETSDITQQLRIDSVNPGGMWVKVFFIGKDKEKDCVRLQAVASGEKEERVGRGRSMGPPQVNGPCGSLGRCQGLI